MLSIKSLSQVLVKSLAWMEAWGFLKFHANFTCTREIERNTSWQFFDSVLPAKIRAQRKITTWIEDSYKTNVEVVRFMEHAKQIIRVEKVCEVKTHFQQFRDASRDPIKVPRRRDGRSGGKKAGNAWTVWHSYLVENRSWNIKYYFFLLVNFFQRFAEHINGFGNNLLPQ